jgi:phospholipase/carboxylesterase
VADLVRLQRPAAGEPAGSLVLLHGRGADERDLFPLLDALDPERRLLGVTPRGPLSLPPGGAHWYRLAGIPTPDPGTFWSSFELLSGLLAELPRPLVLGGFSQGTVMSWALGLGRGPAQRPAQRPAAIVALSGFIPEVEKLELDLSGLEGYPIAIGHGTYDDIIPVQYGRQARQLVQEAGADVLYREYPLPHTIDPSFLPELRDFVGRAAAPTLQR